MTPMMRTSLMRTAIFMFGADLLGLVLARSLDQLAQQVQLVQPQQLLAQQVQPVQQVQVSLVQLVQQVLQEQLELQAQLVQQDLLVLTSVDLGLLQKRTQCTMQLHT
jgi:hypothetical protein